MADDNKLKEEILSILKSINIGMESLHNRLSTIESRMSSLEARMGGLEARFTGLEDSVRKILKFVPTEHADFANRFQDQQ